MPCYIFFLLGKVKPLRPHPCAFALRFFYHKGTQRFHKGTQRKSKVPKGRPFINRRFQPTVMQNAPHLHSVRNASFVRLCEKTFVCLRGKKSYHKPLYRHKCLYAHNKLYINIITSI